MANAGALCSCGSTDVLNMGPSPVKWDHRPEFMCGSCGAEWTNGTEGLPYTPYAGEPTTVQLEQFRQRRDYLHGDAYAEWCVLCADHPELDRWEIYWALKTRDEPKPTIKDHNLMDKYARTTYPKFPEKIRQVVGI